MKYLSVCSGIEAATTAWHPMGWKPIAFSEIEKFPSAVLAHHYPDVPNLGDMTKYQEWPNESIDLLVGGTPCQSFSVAGLRKGLDDPRGNLMLTYGAIAGRYRPRWLVWENVPGVLSSNGGRDFGTFLGMLAELGYGFAYRILDAQYIRVDGFARAVPQRRRRVFVVGHLGDWRRAAAVLFERESLSRHPAPRREAREGIAPTLSARTKGGGGLGTDFDCDGGLVHMCLNAGAMGRLDAESETLIPTFGGVFDVTHATAIRTANTSSNGHGFNDEVAYTLDRTQGQAVAFGWQNSASQGDSASEHCTPTLDKSKTPAVAVALRGRDGGATAELGGEAANALRASQGGGDKPHVLTDTAVRRLTPVECERLQGFPDGYTDIRQRGKATPDGPRYKAIGNSMAVNVMQWIGQRINQVDKL